MGCSSAVGEAGDRVSGEADDEGCGDDEESVAARERAPARAKAAWCGMLRGAKASVKEKRMAAAARSKARSME